MVRLPLSVVERVAEERFGPLTQRLRFTGMTPTSRPLEDAWLRTAALVHEALSGPHPLADEPLLSTHLVQTVAWAALRAFPNTTTTLAHRAGPDWSVPRWCGERCSSSRTTPHCPSR